MKGDLNSDGNIDYSDLAILGNIVAGVAQLPDIDIIVNTSDGPKSDWTVKYYNYDISGNEDYLGEGIITDSVYGNLLIPSNISKHKYIKLESSPNDGAQDILTRIITKFGDNNWQDGDMGKKYSAIIIGSDLPNINWTARITIINYFGKTIHEIGSNLLLGKSGTINWDGKLKDGSIIKPSIYALHINAYNIKTQKTIRQKITFYVNGRLH